LSAASDARAELVERIVADMGRPEAQDPAYYDTLVSDYVALMFRPEVKADNESLSEMISSLDRVTAAWLGVPVSVLKARKR
jgi:hypothetical protein